MKRSEKPETEWIKLSAPIDGRRSFSKEANRKRQRSEGGSKGECCDTAGLQLKGIMSARSTWGTVSISPQSVPIRR